MAEAEIKNEEQIEESKPLLNPTTEEPKTDAENVSDAPHMEKEPEVKVEKSERPAEVPEQFWNEDKGSVDIDGLAKSYNSLRDKMSQGKHKAPKDGKYSTDFIKKIDEQNFEEIEKDDMTQDFLDIAKEENMSQEVVERLFTFYMKQQGVLEQEIEYKRTDELKKLGRNADGIIENMDNWLSSFHKSNTITSEEREAIANASTNALFISALNKIRKSYGEKTIPSSTAVEGNKVTMADVREMMKDERYGKDADYTQGVEKKVYAMHGESY
tara:strand:+ start:952 stop:1761 length:810 start_codon:yes stop_codon:yes gene_type:complete